MEAWRQWLLGGRKTFVHKKQQRIDLTPTGLLMEGDYTNGPIHFQSSKVSNGYVASSESRTQFCLVRARGFEPPTALVPKIGRTRNQQHRLSAADCDGMLQTPYPARLSSDAWPLHRTGRVWWWAQNWARPQIRTSRAPPHKTASPPLLHSASAKRWRCSCQYSRRPFGLWKGLLASKVK